MTPKSRQKTKRKTRFLPVLPRRYWRIWLLLIGSCAVVSLTFNLAYAQDEPDLQKQLEKQENLVIQEYTLPDLPEDAPLYQPDAVPAPEPAPFEEAAPAPAPEPAPEPTPEPAPEPAPAEPATPAAPASPAAPATPISPASPPTPATPAVPVQPSQVPLFQPQPGGVAAEEKPEEPAIAVPVTKYMLEFNRSPVVGDRLRLEGRIDESRIGFTRPRNWQLKSVKALIRYQHSPALIANLSNLTVRVNNASIGSVVLNRQEAEIGTVTLDVPLNRLRDYNEISLIARQHNETDCTKEDPRDPTLWTEILPDSKLIFDFQPKPIPLNFNTYPYPFVDPLSLEANGIAYLKPKTVTDTWLTAAARHSITMGRLADYRPLETRVIDSLADAKPNERVIILGTPAEQPDLSKLRLPLRIAKNQVLDKTGNPLPFDLGILMLATSSDRANPILVATGNDEPAVAKAVQALAQPQDRKIMAGAVTFVKQLNPVPIPPPRLWPRALPEKNKFALKHLKTETGQPFADITVRGAGSPPITFDFHALPDDRFKRGSSMNLIYSYGPQINPRKSAVEVLLDGVFIGGARLTKPEGEIRKTLKVDLPANLVKPNSKIQVAFRLSPKEEGACGRSTDEQLMGTLHADTNFKLHRETSVVLPDLKLLQFGFPFAQPQDLSNTAIVLADKPSTADLTTLIDFSTRMGRLSQSDAVQVTAYTKATLPEKVKKSSHLVGIGTQAEFPLPEVFESQSFSLGNLFSRGVKQTQLQTLPDTQGVVKSILSPYRRDRVLLGLTAQTEEGMAHVGELFKADPWFFQLKGDTTLISSNTKNPLPDDPNTYQLEFLEEAPTRRLENTSLLSKASRFLQQYWWVLPIGIITLALILYGLVQVYIKRMGTIEDSKSTH